ncbi:ankyrin [Rozella allomycis CSF55]|uniref:Ankyrin n=1 Tax=Rozella allomycis (strain CSF55) TaxID=988480 RepID=A0A4P9YFB4_ROZAC|nr:ankyrin [Rozella allomycis CSF55]
MRVTEWEFIQQTLRTICLKHNASLSYFTNKNKTKIRNLILSKLTNQEFKDEACVIDKENVFVPFNWDTEGKIKALNEGFEFKYIFDSSKQQVIDFYNTKIPNKTNKVKMKSDQNTTRVAVDEQLFLKDLGLYEQSNDVTTDSKVNLDGLHVNTKLDLSNNQNKFPAASINPKPLKDISAGESQSEVLANFFQNLLSKKNTVSTTPPSTTSEMKRNDFAAELERLRNKMSFSHDCMQLDYSTEDSLNIFEASQKGNLLAVKYWIEEQGCDINVKDQYEATALHWAAINGHLDVIQYLIDNNANLNAMGGTTPSTPLIQGVIPATAMLLKAGANVNEEDALGFSPIHVSSQNGQYFTTLLLIGYGAFINARDSNNRTHKNALDDLGNTPLHWAVYKENYQFVEALLKFNVSLDIHNSEGYNPVQLASNLKINWFAKLLEKYEKKRGKSTLTLTLDSFENAVAVKDLEL